MVITRTAAGTSNGDPQRTIVIRCELAAISNTELRWGEELASMRWPGVRIGSVGPERTFGGNRFR